jgi:hypothetical protein
VHEVVPCSPEGDFHDREDFLVLFHIKVFAIMGMGRRREPESAPGHGNPRQWPRQVFPDHAGKSGVNRQQYVSIQVASKD